MNKVYEAPGFCRRGPRLNSVKPGGGKIHTQAAGCWRWEPG